MFPKVYFSIPFGGKASSFCLGIWSCNFAGEYVHIIKFWSMRCMPAWCVSLRLQSSYKMADSFLIPFKEWAPYLPLFRAKIPIQKIKGTLWELWTLNNSSQTGNRNKNVKNIPYGSKFLLCLFFLSYFLDYILGIPNPRTVQLCMNRKIPQGLLGDWVG